MKRFETLLPRVGNIEPRESSYLGGEPPRHLRFDASPTGYTRLWHAYRKHSRTFRVIDGHGEYGTRLVRIPAGVLVMYDAYSDTISKERLQGRPLIDGKRVTYGRTEFLQE